MVTLTSNSTIAGNTQICPGQILKYHCRSNFIQDETIRWFICSNISNCDDYGNKRGPLAPTEIHPIIGERIPGVVITLDAFTIFEPFNNSFISTLTVNTSEFDYSRELIFKCGTFTDRSNPLLLNFTINSKQH